MQNNGKKLVVFGLAVFMAPFVMSADTVSQGMGLDGKRKLNRAKEVYVSGYQKHLLEVCGSPISIDVDFDSFKDSASVKNMQNDVFLPVDSAFTEICSQDEIGKKSVVAAIKRVTIKNISDPSKKSAKVRDGQLSIEAAYGVDKGFFKSGELKKSISSQL